MKMVQQSAHLKNLKIKFIIVCGRKINRLFRVISHRIFQWLCRPEDSVFKSGLFPANTSHDFSKLTLQNKILTVGKLISQLQSDDLLNIDLARKALLALNCKLNQQIISTWNEAYFIEPPIKKDRKIYRYDLLNSKVK